MATKFAVFAVLCALATLVYSRSFLVGIAGLSAVLSLGYLISTLRRACAAQVESEKWGSSSLGSLAWAAYHGLFCAMLLARTPEVGWPCGIGVMIAMPLALVLNRKQPPLEPASGS